MTMCMDSRGGLLISEFTSSYPSRPWHSILVPLLTSHLCFPLLAPSDDSPSNKHITAVTNCPGCRVQMCGYRTNHSQQVPHMYTALGNTIKHQSQYSNDPGIHACAYQASSSMYGGTALHVINWACNKLGGGGGGAVRPLHST